ncbi:MAG: four helix bundle protein [Coriobacteriales bacterium]|jgi:hypothetical protein|nr:four helix bundle protein [Coriobacteriales bacterium]
MAEKHQSELSIVMKAKDLCKYVMTITQKSPKQYRFTFTIRMQNLCMSIIENVYLANETFVGGTDAKAKYQKRLDFQHTALTQIKLLAYFAQISLELKAILPRHYEQIAKQTSDCQYLLGGWMKSDKNRFRMA